MTTRTLLLIASAAALVLLLPQVAGETFARESPYARDVNAIVVDDERIYMAHSSGYIVAADADTGDIEWSDRIEAASGAVHLFGIAQTPDLVAVGSAFRTSQADFSDPVAFYDKATGQKLFSRTYQRPDCSSAPEGTTCARDVLRLAADGDQLYLGFDRGLVALIDADPMSSDPGRVIWSAILPQVAGAETANVGAMALDSQYVYVAVNDNLGATPNHDNNRLHVLDRATGQVLRSGYISLATGAVNAVINGLHADGDSVYVAMFGGRIVKINAYDGTPGVGDYAATGTRTIIGDNSQPRTPVSITGDATAVYTAHLGGWTYKINKADMTSAWVDADDDPAPKHVMPRDSRAIALAPGGWIAQGYDDGAFARITTSAGPVVTLVTPNGGEFLKGTSDQEFLWRMNDHHSTNGLLQNPYLVDVSFFVSNDGGQTYPGQPALKIVEKAFTFSQLNRQPAFDTRTLPEGSGYKIKVIVDDPDGFSATDESDATFTIDRTAPVIGGVYPAPSEAVASNAPRVSVAFSDSLAGVDPASIRFFIDDDTPRTPQEVSVGSAAYTWSNPFPLAQGFHAVRVELADRAGNPVSKEWNFRVDTVAPETPVTVPGRNTFTANDRPDLDLRYIEPVHLISATFGPVGAAGVDVTDKVQHPEVNRLRFRPAETLEAGGRYALSVTVKDDVGNVATTTLPFGIDTTKPQVSIEALSETPGHGAVTGKRSLVLSLAATDDFAGLDTSRTSWRFNSQDRSAQVLHQDGRILLAVKNLPSGVYENVVDVFDKAGNRQTFTWSFRVDAQAPAVDVEVLPPGTQKAVKLNDRLELEVTATDVDKVAKVEIDWNTLDDAAGYQTIAGITPGPAVAVRAETIVRETANRNVDVNVRITDAQGNRAIEVITVQVDNVIPQATMDKLPRFTGRDIPLSWSGSDGYGRVAHFDVEVSIDGGNYAPVVEKTTATQTTFSTAADVAELRFRVWATDEAGNRQAIPSTPAATSVVGDVFDDVIVPDRLEPGQEGLFVAALVTKVAYPIDDVRLLVQRVGNASAPAPIDMDRLDANTYALDWSAPVEEGRYAVRFVARSPDGGEFTTPAMFVDVRAAAEPILSNKESPGPLALVPLVAALALWRRRP